MEGSAACLEKRRDDSGVKLSVTDILRKRTSLGQHGISPGWVIPGTAPAKSQAGTLLNPRLPSSWSSAGSFLLEAVVVLTSKCSAACLGVTRCQQRGSHLLLQGARAFSKIRKLITTLKVSKVCQLLLAIVIFLRLISLSEQ